MAASDTLATTALSRRDQKRLEAMQRQARSRERKAQEQLVRRLEQEIQELETRQAALIADLEKRETYERSGGAVGINRELLTVQERLAELQPEWEQQATKLAEFDAAHSSQPVGQPTGSEAGGLK